MKPWQIFLLVIIIGVFLLAIVKMLVVYGVVKKAIDATQQSLTDTETQLGAGRLTPSESTLLLAKRDLLKAELSKLIATYNKYK